MGKINHCGKNFPAENRFVVTNYPGFGDVTYFDYARCQVCNNSVHSYWIQYFRAKAPTEVVQSDKHTRGRYDDLIRSGKAFIIPDSQDEIPRNTRAQVLAGEWTLNSKKPADLNAVYLARNDRAPWVSNRSVLMLTARRNEWLREYRNRVNEK